MKIDAYIKKALLQQVEAAGETRENSNLRSIYNTDTETFGTAGSEKRRFIQLFWNNLKKGKVLKTTHILLINIWQLGHHFKPTFCELML